MSKNEFHSIKAYLYNNALTPDPNDMVARVSSERSKSVADICRSATTRGGADISAASMEHAVKLFHKELAYALCDGFSVNVGIYTAAPLIRGVFTSPTEQFDPARHQLLFEFQQGAEMRQEVARTRVSIMGMAESGCYIAQVTDVNTGSVNSLLTPGKVLKIAGQKIKIAGNHADNGVYFVDESGNRTPVVQQDMVTNNPSELAVMIPPLGAGSYRVEVVTQYAGTTPLRQPRMNTFDKLLTVQ